MSDTQNWPSLPLNEWRDTYRSLHMWTQIVGKIRMTLSPPLNHWWNVTLYVNPRGLTTGPVPYPPGVFEIQFDFQKHALQICTSEGANVSRPLVAESVASFYGGILERWRPRRRSRQPEPARRRPPGAASWSWPRAAPA